MGAQVRRLTCCAGFEVECRCCGFCTLSFGAGEQLHVFVDCVVRSEELRSSVCRVSCVNCGAAVGGTGFSISWCWVYSVLRSDPCRQFI